jgi:pilus assembly protein Flp/PilA
MLQNNVGGLIAVSPPALMPKRGVASNGFHGEFFSESVWMHKGVRAMSRFKQIVKWLYADEDGAALVEYGLLVALIAIAALAAIQAVGGGITALFTQVGGLLTP